MARTKFTPRCREFRVEVVEDLPKVGSSIVAGLLRATFETPWVAVVGSHASRPRPEVIVFSDSSDSHSSSDRVSLTFRRTR
jgi:hypothetical protein